MTVDRGHQLGDAQTLQQAGRLAEAMAIYRELVSENPHDPFVIHYLGMAEFQSSGGSVGLGRVDNSIALLPERAEFLANRASVNLESGDLVAARTDAARALRLQPDLTGALLTLGWASLRSNQHDSAASIFSRSLVANPTDVPSWMGLFRTRAAVSDARSALEGIQRICQIDRYHEEALFECGSWNYNIGDHADAVEAFLRLVTLQPAHRVTCFRLSVVWRVIREVEYAVRWSQRAVVIDPCFASACYEVGLSLDQRGDWQQAVDSFRRARALDPSHADCDVSLSTTLLRAGRFAEGWHHYRARWWSESLARKHILTPVIESSKPDFVGPLTERRVLIWGEQGVGDDIMFGSLLREFGSCCGEMLVQVDRRLMGFFERAFPGIRVFERGKRVSEDLYDEQLPMGDLGKWLRPTRASFEGKSGAYMSAKEGLAQRLRAELGVGSRERLVGLGWRSANPLSGSARSIPLRLIGEHLSIPGVRFVNLQYGDLSPEIDALKQKTGMAVVTHPGIDNMQDLEGLAGLIEACDLVVTVGNATAHLAGALGQSTWVLLPYVSGWRWLHEGKRCPWYESVTLYRQQQRDSWTSVLEAVGRDLVSLARSDSP